VAREEWGRTLWARLNPLVLTNGIDDFFKSFYNLPIRTQQNEVGQTLELLMKNLRNDILLMLDLKNVALRERHWNELMAKTGIANIFVTQKIENKGARLHQTH
jgi:dynein heavy chain